jgi:hypothetical protein
VIPRAPSDVDGREFLRLLAVDSDPAVALEAREVIDVL